ncbi:transporter [Cognatilysobacter bugurensis]|uniref:Transporter n=1 Tax=Cognatilysobacter bugurensis TaxID=543356 RepID=A0A918T3J0_9GAMM|nr:transporter [Lysobacter bugurensis]GHA87139.1 hypothetical protein GCM10007067_26240 [Lysobacter bugurensis]
MRTLSQPPAFAPLFIAVALALGGTAHAAEPVSQDVLLARLDALAGQVEAQQAEIARLRAQLEEVELAQRGRGLPAAPMAAAPQPFAIAQAGAAPAADATSPPGAPEPSAAPTPAAAPVAAPVQIGQARAEENAERREQERALVVREHAPLFERTLTFDAGYSYSYYDRRQLALSGFLALDAIFLGTINLDQTKATLMTLDLSARYGLTDRLSLEATVPYVWRDTRFVSAGAGGASNVVTELQLHSNGIGDASLALYYQWIKESARLPDIVTSLRVRGPTGRSPFGLKLIQPDAENSNLNVPEDLPTGTGLWSATANVSALRTYDPVILFGNLGFTWNRANEFDDISPVLNQTVPARVSLGNTIQLSGGIAIALNDRSAISFSAASALSAATHTKVPGQDEEQRVPGSSVNATTLNIGASYALPSGWTLNGQLAAGLTPDAPNFVFGLRASHSF